MFFAFPSLIIASSAILLTAHAQCLFNATHCDCAINTATPGLCTRYSVGAPSAATCYVDNCMNNAHICDCTGTEICELYACDAWRANNPADVTTVGDVVSCTFRPDGALCISPLPATPSPSASVSATPSSSASSTPVPSASASPAVSSSISPVPSAPSGTSPTPSSTVSASPSPPPDYRMVQWGPASGDNMFNMSAFVDVNDFITTNYDMAHTWPNPSHLESRWHTVMLYTNDAGDTHFLCHIINTYDGGNDGLGMMETNVTVTGVDGQIVEWAACDDADDSCQSSSGVSISSYFGNTADLTDGYCIKPIDYSGNTVTIQVTDVQRARGIRFVQPSGTVREYLFAGGPSNGMTGTMDANGLVSSGYMPAITFNLNGIMVP